MRWLSICALAAALAGCAVLRMPGSRPTYSQEELREELSDFAGHFHLLVSQAADTIDASTSDPAIRKRTLMWKLQFIPLVEQAAVDPNPQEGFVSLLTLVVSAHQNLGQEPAGGLFGEQQQVAIEVVRELEAELRGIGSRFLGAKEMARVEQEIEGLVRAQPAGRTETAMQSIRRTLAGVEQSSAFRRVVSVPLSPFRALEGVGNSADEIRDFNTIARGFARSMERLPEQLRWQIELLLFEIESRETTRAGLASLQSVAGSAERLSGVAAALPDDVRSLLEDSSATLAQLQEVVSTAQALAGPLRDASEQLQRASASWEVILGPREGGAERPPGRPFDVREWESAVREIGATAQHLERLLQEVRATGEAEPLAAALERADRLTRAWIDLAAWRVAQLMLAGLALALAYRLIAARLARR
jgi:hypothetical protein